MESYCHIATHDPLVIAGIREVGGVQWMHELFQVYVDDAIMRLALLRETIESHGHKNPVLRHARHHAVRAQIPPEVWSSEDLAAPTKAATQLLDQLELEFDHIKKALAKASEVAGESMEPGVPDA